MATTDNSFIGLENAINANTTWRRNYGTAAASEQTGYEASKLADEHLGIVWRAATADVNYTPLLARFDDLYRVGLPAVLSHNLSPTSQWRLTLDPSYTIRPVWQADGTGDEGDTAETIPQTGDITVCWQGYIPPQDLDAESTVVAILALKNAANGERLRVAVRTSAASFPLQLYAISGNFASGNALISSLKPSGTYVRWIYRYRTSDDKHSFTVNGVEVSGTASQSVAGTEGAVEMEISKFGSTECPAWHQDIAIYNRYLDDDEVTGYKHRVLDGGERGLIGSWHFLEGTGTTVADTTGTTTLNLTNGEWAEMVNPNPAFSTGVLEGIGQWHRREGLRISDGTAVTSPSLGTATRDITVSGIIDVQDDHDPGTDTEIVVFGPSTANAEIALSVNASGQLALTSNRGTPDTVTSTSIRGLGPIRFRCVLESTSNTASALTLYTAVGTADEASVGSVNVGAYDAVASCLLILGDGAAGSDNSNGILSSVRVYGAKRLAAEDDLTGMAHLTDPALLEWLVLDGEVVSEVDDTRVFTTASLTYEDVTNPNPTRPAPGREGLGYPYTSGRTQIEAELIDFTAGSDVEASEAFLEVWDRKNADGYVEAGALVCLATVRPDENRIDGAERTWRPRPALRTAIGGVPYLDDDWEAPVGRIHLKYLDIIDEQDEWYRRVLRARRDKLVGLVIEPSRLEGQTKTALPQHLLIDYTVFGVLSVDTTTVKESNSRHVEMEISVEGVRRQTT